MYLNDKAASDVEEFVNSNQYQIIEVQDESKTLRKPQMRAVEQVRKPVDRGDRK